MRVKMANISSFLVCRSIQTKVSTLVQGFPHLGQQKWLSFPAPFEELLPLLTPVGGSVGILDPVLHSQTVE